MGRAFEKFLDTCKAGREDSEAHFRERGLKEDRRKVSEHIEGHYKNEGREKEKELYTPRYYIIKTVNLMRARVWTVKPSKIVQTLKPS